MQLIRTRKIRRYRIRRSSCAGKRGRNPLDSFLIFTEVTAQVLNDQTTLKMKNARVVFSFSNVSSSFLIILWNSFSMKFVGVVSTLFSWKMLWSPLSRGKSVWLSKIIIRWRESCATSSKVTSFLRKVKMANLHSAQYEMVSYKKLSNCGFLQIAAPILKTTGICTSVLYSQNIEK